MAAIAAVEVFREVGRQSEEFATYDELRKVVLKAFNAHLRDFPRGYTYLDLLQWARDQQWIEPSGGGFRLAVPGASAHRPPTGQARHGVEPQETREASDHA